MELFSPFRRLARGSFGLNWPGKVMTAMSNLARSSYVPITVFRILNGHQDRQGITQLQVAIRVG